MKYKTCLGYVPISSSALRHIGSAFVIISLSEVEQEQRPSRNGDHEAIVVGADVCDGESERARSLHVPHNMIVSLSEKPFSKQE